MEDKDKKIFELQERIKKLEDDLMHDHLTRLKTRQYLIDRAESIFADFSADNRRNDYCFASVIFCDIDNFKQINDQYGHGIGDEVLRRVATRIKNCVRQMDVVSRWGGEEIVVFMTGGCHDSQFDPAIRAEVIRSEVERIHLNDNPDLRVSLSLGVARAKITSNINLASLIKSADEAMYQAKKEGKNRVVTVELADTRD